MSIIAVGVIAVVALILVAVGIVVGWAIGTNDGKVEILARGLVTEQRIEAATRATLAAMVDAEQRRSV